VQSEAAHTEASEAVDAAVSAAAMQHAAQTDALAKDHLAGLGMHACGAEIPSHPLVELARCWKLWADETSCGG
jgi:hypothetical protein